MCGIFGQVGAPLSQETIKQVLAVLQHRGPDRQKSKPLTGATLLHAHLKVVDLSPESEQPMTSEDGQTWVTFNGMIYNFRELRRELEHAGHRFVSNSDTEVIVHGYEEWGDDVVSRLDGMFAFGLWDQRRQRLLAARDRSGKKPLFYAEHDGSFLFGSSPKALFAAGHPLEVAPRGVATFLAYGFAAPPYTFYKNVSQLPPAHFLVREGTQTKLSRYWSFQVLEAPTIRSESEAIAKLRPLVEQAVKRRLVAEVPLGAFLSGGIDSSIIVGLMAKHMPRVKTFSLGFVGDARYDETPFARIVAQKFNTEHHEFMVEPDALSLIDELVWHHDGPFGDSSAIPTYLVSKYTREHVTVALSGDGGDELFAGYLRFFAARLAENIPAPLRAIGRWTLPLLPEAPAERSLLGRGKRFIEAGAADLPERLLRWSVLFATELSATLRPELFAQISREEILAYHRRFFEGRGTTLSKLLRHNFESYLPEDLLVKSDRCSMAHALELRAPFLDTALIEFSTRLPDHVKLRGKDTKYILKEAFSDLLPSEITRRGKMGFGVPLASWFRNELKGFVEERLCPGAAKLNQFVAAGVAERLVREHISGRADHSHRLWALLTLEVWLQRLDTLAQPLLQK
jgi:asparagine synthase (glutamine-hydrolysing)